MVILLVKNNSHYKEFYFNRLASFSESDTIVVVDSVERAKDFIISQLIRKGLHIDFILTNHKFGQEKETSHDLIKWLKSSEQAYFQKSLRLASLPVVLIRTGNDNTQTDYLLGFDNIILSKEIEDARRVAYHIKSAISSWIEKLLNDYEILGIDAKNPMPLSLIGAWREKCVVLTRDYSLKPFKLPFLIFQKDIDEVELRIDYFIKTVNDISKSKKPRQEKKYHELLRTHDEFLLGEAFDKPFYEKNFLLHQNKKRKL